MRTITDNLKMTQPITWECLEIYIINSVCLLTISQMPFRSKLILLHLGKGNFVSHYGVVSL